MKFWWSWKIPGEDWADTSELEGCWFQFRQGESNRFSWHCRFYHVLFHGMGLFLAFLSETFILSPCILNGKPAFLAQVYWGRISFFLPSVDIVYFLRYSYLRGNGDWCAGSWEQVKNVFNDKIGTRKNTSSRAVEGGGEKTMEKQNCNNVTSEPSSENE